MKKTITLLAMAFCLNVFAQNTWLQKADFGGGTRFLAVGFSIGNYGYIGTGDATSNQNDFWQYDPPVIRGSKKQISPVGQDSVQLLFP